MMKLTGIWTRVLGLTVLAAILFPGTARAAVNAYLKLEGVKGESTDVNHQGWIEISSFQWGMLQQRADAEKRGGPVNRAPLVITKEWDAASPKLKAMCASGKHFAQLDIDVVSGGKTMHYHLINVTVSSFQMSGGGRPQEEISFTFQKITMNY